MPYEKKFDVFLSHNSKDKPWVIKLKQALEECGITVWLDKDEIRPGDLFAKALEKGIRQSKSVAIVVSPESVESGWVENEYYRALSLATSEGTQLIPVILKLAEIPGFLKDRTWVDFSNEAAYEKNMKKLIWGITGSKLDDELTISIDPLVSLPDHLQTALQMMEQQRKFFFAKRTIYQDQCENVINEVDELNHIIENISTSLSSDYNALLFVTNLQTKIRKYKNYLVEFCNTCPPGNVKQLKIITDHIATIHHLLKTRNDI